MILIFGSSLFGRDDQSNLLKDVLARSGKEFVFINPLDPFDMARVELEMHGQEVTLLIDKKAVRPHVVYMSRLWRTDCMIDVPEDCAYPTIFRQKAHSLLSEIRFVLDDLRWLPGKLENIERGDAKISLMRLANVCGLLTPRASTVSFCNPSQDASYRKSLGPPFTITFDRVEGVENAVTLFNKIHKEGESTLGLPWQWQTHIDATAQVRCVVVANSVRAYIADIEQFKGKEFREANDAGLDIKWAHHKLPETIEISLLRLCNRLELTMCCPEFLISADKKYTFIDLNPCGDWHGFVDEEENLKVAEMIAKTL